KPPCKKKTSHTLHFHESAGRGKAGNGGPGTAARHPRRGFRPIHKRGSAMPTTAYIALGSNLGDRAAFLQQALELLRATPGVRVVRVPAWHETDPVGGPAGQGRYLNGAAELEVDLEPAALLHALFEVERKLGRERGERFGPRTIDLDLLLYGTLVL